MERLMVFNFLVLFSSTLHQRTGQANYDTLWQLVPITRHALCFAPRKINILTETQCVIFWFENICLISLGFPWEPKMRLTHPPTNIRITKRSKKKSGKCDQLRKVDSLVESVTHWIGMASQEKPDSSSASAWSLSLTLILILDIDPHWIKMATYS